MRKAKFSDEQVIAILREQEAGRATVKPPVSVDSGQVSFHPSKLVSDAAGDKLNYKTTGLPPGLKIDPATGLVTGMLTKDASKGGPYTVTLTVDDGHGGKTTKTFVWPVTNPAPVAGNDNGSDKAGHFFKVPVLANDSDPDGDPLTVTRANAGHGTVEILPDGAIKYTPRPGFVGTDTITYVMSDGNGGTAIASVTISVADDDYYDKPQVFGFEGPERQSSGALAAHDYPHESITAEGAVDDAVFGIDQLSGLANQLSAEGVVLAAANSGRSLNGIGSMSANGAIIETIRAERAIEIAGAAGFERSNQVWNIECLPGFSLRNNVPGNLGGLGSREQVIIESIVRERTLIVQISNTLKTGDKRIVDYRITQADGTPLPEWLNRAGKELLIGQREPNQEFISLKVEALYTDGSVVVEQVKIDSATGEISPLKPGRQGFLQPKLFGDQLRARPMQTRDEM